ncbi:unnamed protein product [Arabidopsis lyrata]|uniref:F-box domain-containing protein n=1 Tax=Arabidopsis lyrata subsp. lyrata TaxID=81972 RepID=D7LFH2_ARALL|nr:hypothetical protein ARALYDRAFT_901531 [Arabidopsis lyrata subsp. lyrata]CAH8263802.1 unnamed protein product [Arabidopsis lyrata]
MSSSSRNLISNLPNEILTKILSSLATKVVASTQILSKRWKNLLGLVDTLWFYDSMVVYPNIKNKKGGLDRLCDFVEKTFALSSNSPIKKLSLPHRPRPNRPLHSWIWTAMERGLLELHLHAGQDDNDDAYFSV